MVLALSGCVTPSGQPDNTATGALSGGAVGAIIGSAVARNPGVGAAIGAATGVIAGGLIGHGFDQAQQARLQAAAPQTWQRVAQGQPLAIEDVKALSRAGLSDKLIISQIHNTGTIYYLGTADIIALKNAGISEAVIDFMINTPSRALAPPTAATVVSVPVATVVAPVVVMPGYYPYPYPCCYGWGWYGGYWRGPGRCR